MLLTANDLNRHITALNFDYYQCGNCKLIFLSPVPLNLGDYYTVNYYAVPKTEDELRPLFSRENNRLQVVKPFVKQGKLLEIGPAFGSFLYFARQAGYIVTGLEMDAACCTFVRDVLNIDCIHTNNPAAAIQQLETYDVITMWQVLEHLNDYQEVLKTVAAHLAPGGIVALSTPNPDSFQFSIFGKYWTHLDAPRHLVLVSPKLLSAQLRDLGLETKLLECGDEETLMHSTYGWRRSLQNVMGKTGQLGVSYVRTHRNSPVNTATGNLYRGLVRAINMLERRTLRACSYTAIFQKPPSL